MRILLTLAFLFAFSASAFAEGNRITVVNPDGTKTSIDIGPTPAPAQKPAADPAPQAPPQKKSEAKPAPKPAPKKQAVKKETPTKKAPAKKTPVKKDLPEKKKAAPVPHTQAAPVPTPKAPRPSAAAPAQNLGPNMTPDDAVRIALDAAPPARSVHAVPVNHNGLHAYQVIFATEDGDRSVFVDRETGRIVR